MEIIRGREVVAALQKKMQKNLAGLGGYIPRLAIVRVGERSEDLSYERAALKKMELSGLKARVYAFPENTSMETFLSGFRTINDDPDVDGILLFQPLPSAWDADAIARLIHPEKDLDGISPINQGRLYRGENQGFAPCTARAVMETLEYAGISLEGKQVVILGRSLVVGKPLSMLMLQKNATVTICHSRTENLREVCRGAQVLVAAVGRARMVDASYVSKGTIVMDVGINLDEEGRLCGDVNMESLENTAAICTPVPGGIGAVTTSVLGLHLTEAALRKKGCSI